MLPKRNTITRSKNVKKYFNNFIPLNSFIFLRLFRFANGLKHCTVGLFEQYSSNTVLFIQSLMRLAVRFEYWSSEILIHIPPSGIQWLSKSKLHIHTIHNALHEAHCFMSCKTYTTRRERALIKILIQAEKV